MFRKKRKRGKKKPRNHIKKVLHPFSSPPLSLKRERGERVRPRLSRFRGGRGKKGGGGGFVPVIPRGRGGKKGEGIERGTWWDLLFLSSSEGEEGRAFSSRFLRLPEEEGKGGKAPYESSRVIFFYSLGGGRGGKKHVDSNTLTHE